jgi:hemerythrin-like domain-containing protein
MKRYEELAPLSREHNRALLLARNARRAAGTGDPRRIREAWEALACAFRDEMRAHFATEERLVVTLLTEFGEHDLAERLGREHRAMARNFGDPALWTRDRLAVLADVLHEHVRVEERRVFPLVQRHASPALLAALADHPDAGDAATERRSAD